MRDLGEHRLKDLSAPEPLYQLGERDFPPLNSLHQSNLPVPSSSFVGRERELAAAAALLARPDVRLVTLTGSGGSGKTRLALASAAELVDDFATASGSCRSPRTATPELVEPTIAQVLGARGDLNEFLRGRQLLLLLDNLEQLLPDVAETVAGLEAKVLATSRERLNLRAEHEYPVPMLPLDDAVELFIAARPSARPALPTGRARA